MRAIVFDGAAPALVGNRPDPEAGPGEVRVRTSRAAISEADLAICRGAIAFTGVLGHEFVGTVETTGADVDDAWIGRRVVGAVAEYCGKCDLCLKGLRTHCRQRTLLGLDGRDGCLADRFTLSAAGLVGVPDSVDDDHAIFAHLLAGALQASRHVTVEGKPYITVLGDGPLGLLVAQVMARRNASVRLVGAEPGRLSLCEKWRIKHRPAGDTGRRADQDVVVDCTGTTEGLGLALQLLRPRGTLMLTAPYLEGSDGLGPALAGVVRDEVRIVGSFVGPIGEAVSVLQRSEVDVLSLIDRRMRLDDGERALQAAAEPGALRVLVDP